jgi:hypothetical protein
MKGSSGAPTPPIWIRWSITENHMKPWFGPLRLRLYRLERFGRIATK